MPPMWKHANVNGQVLLKNACQSIYVEKEETAFVEAHMAIMEGVARLHNVLAISGFRVR